MDTRRRISFNMNTSSGGSTTTGTYTVNLNSQWEKTTAVTNPDSTLYDGVYRSSSNYNVNNGVSIMYVDISGYSEFTLYIRSYAESNYDYVMVSQLDQTITGSSSYSDTTLVKAHTRGNQQSGTAISNYTEVNFTGIDGGSHRITILYRKDGSVNSGDDRGYLLIKGGASGGSGGGSEGGGDVTGPINTDNYLTILALQDGLTAKLSVNACQYCVDGDGNWKTLAAGTNTETINRGQTLSFKGNLTPDSSNGIGTFTISSMSCNLEGNCMSMLFGDDAISNVSLSGKDYAFYRLFYKCTTVKNVSSGFLPATTLSNRCYNQMFMGCTGLTTTPELPATTLSNMCYYSMFNGCIGLTTTPELPATTLSGACYSYMFKGCTSLTTAPILPATTLVSGCYSYMFNGCTSLTTAPELPATILGSSCYHSMFDSCTSLTTAPELPATDLLYECYAYMFWGCTSLTKAPELPATILGAANYCYEAMFQGCIGLTTAPELPATTLSNCCYISMFMGCTSLTTAPELPATTLSNSCYASMFYDCTSLTTAPELPATTLTTYCYEAMFYGCSSLNYIKMLATDIPAESCLINWVSGVSSTGTFVKNPDMTSLPTGTSGIPSGWAVIDDTDETLTFPITLNVGDNGDLGVNLYNYLLEKYNEQTTFNEQYVTEDISINSDSYGGEVKTIITQLAVVSNPPDMMYLSTQQILDIEDEYWYSSRYFYLESNGYLGYYND